jgi:hypothetical protein
VAQGVGPEFKPQKEKKKSLNQKNVSFFPYLKVKELLTFYLKVHKCLG